MAEPPLTRAQERLDLADLIHRARQKAEKPSWDDLRLIENALRSSLQLSTNELADEIDAIAKDGLDGISLYEITALQRGAAALRSVDWEIARLKVELEDLRAAFRAKYKQHEKAEAALAEMRRMVEEPSEELVASIMAALIKSSANYTADAVPKTELAEILAREAIAALARHATEET